MNTALRRSLFTVFAAGLPLVGACNSAKPTADILAEDSSLAVAVMTANQDTLSLADADTLSIAPVTAPIVSERPSRVSSVEARDRSVAPASVSVSSPAPKRLTPRRVRRSSQIASTRSVSRSSNPGVRRTPRRERVRVAPESRTVNSNPVQPVTATNRSVFPDNTSRMRATATLPAGSELVLSASERVCSATGTVGDRFIAETAEDVVGPLGVVIPRGSVASGVIVSRSTNPKRSDAVLRIQSLTVRGRTYDVASEVTNMQLDNVRTGSKAAPTNVIVGAGLGAILGRVIGGNTRATVIGAAGGAAAGAVVASRSTRSDRCIPSGGRINARLSEPLRISMAE
ncbi:MAG: glycine zipper 2TM domain-containing protein [Gemmatimonadales bacterium]